MKRVGGKDGRLPLRALGATVLDRDIIVNGFQSNKGDERRGE